jgi:phosphoglycolate phosphatase-like HAD superfamily hydrolase
MTHQTLEADIERIRRSGISDGYKLFMKLSDKEISKREYIDSYDQSFRRLLKDGALPIPEKYPLANWIFLNKERYHFLYATGGQGPETRYVLESFGLAKCFDLENSIDKTKCRFSKRTGIPFRKIKARFGNCILVSDSNADCEGAALCGIPCILVLPGQKIDLDADKHIAGYFE